MSFRECIEDIKSKLESADHGGGCADCGQVIENGDAEWLLETLTRAVDLLCKLGSAHLHSRVGISLDYTCNCGSHDSTAEFLKQSGIDEPLGMRVVGGTVKGQQKGMV